MNFNFSQKQQLQSRLQELLSATQEVKTKLNGIDATERFACECLDSITDTKNKLEEMSLDKAAMIEWQHEGIRRLGVSLEIDPTTPGQIENLKNAVRDLTSENFNLQEKLRDKSDTQWSLRCKELEQKLESVNASLEGWKKACEKAEFQLAQRGDSDVISHLEEQIEALRRQLQETSESRDSWKQEFETQQKQFEQLLAEVQELRKPSTTTAEVIQENGATSLPLDTAATSILKIGAIVENNNGVFGEVIAIDKDGIYVRHVTGQKLYQRNQLREMPAGANIKIPQPEEAGVMSVADFLGQNGIKKVTWEQVRDWTGKNQEKLQDLLNAGANAKTKKAKEFTSSLPEKCAEYIEKSSDDSDLEWIPEEFKQQVATILNKEPKAEEQAPVLTIPSNIALNDIVAIGDKVGTVTEINGAEVFVKISDTETRIAALDELTWLSSYQIEQAPVAEPVVEEVKEFQEFWKKYAASTAAFKALDWMAITDAVQGSDEKLKEIVSSAPDSIQKKLNNGHLAELLAAYIQESDDKSDLEWITEPLLTQVEDMLASVPEDETLSYQIDDLVNVDGKDGLWTIKVIKGSGWYTLEQNKEEIDAHAKELELLSVGF